MRTYRPSSQSIAETRNVGARKTSTQESRNIRKPIDLASTTSRSSAPSASIMSDYTRKPAAVVHPIDADKLRVKAALLQPRQRHDKGVGEPLRTVARVRTAISASVALPESVMLLQSLCIYSLHAPHHRFVAVVIADMSRGFHSLHHRCG